MTAITYMKLNCTNVLKYVKVNVVPENMLLQPGGLSTSSTGVPENYIVLFFFHFPDFIYSGTALQILST